MKKALLQEKINKDTVKCKNCAHFCLLKEGDFGKCNTRENKGGSIKAINYGMLSTYAVDPIEKKPIYHFFPGTKTFSIAAPGCSFKCRNCQNWRMVNKKVKKKISPEKVVEVAIEKDVSSISYTYSEPIMFLEYALDIMKIAKKNGLKNVWVSNGFFSDDSLKLVLPYIDAINIDLKSFSDQFYKKICNGRLDPVLKSIEKINGNSWLEITTLLIPGYNTDQKELKKIARFIFNLNKNIPWHISAFSGRLSRDMKDIPDTGLKEIESAYKIGKETGLNYVYPGNIITNKKDTECPNCGTPLIKRERYKVQKLIEDNTCHKCGQESNLILK